MLNATIVDRKEVTPELFVLHVKPDSNVPEFLPGQYVALGLPGAAPRPKHLPPDRDTHPEDKLIKRAYSIGSSPGEKRYLEFYVAVVPEGALTPRLSVPVVGERIYIAPKITGTFTLDPVPADHNLIFISTGTGIAPFMSMIRTAETWNAHRKITLVHGVRHAKDLAYRDELFQMCKENKNLSYHALISRTDPSWNGPTGRTQTLIHDGTLQPNPEIDHIFLCGNPAMIDEMEELLGAKGYSVYSKKNPSGKLHLERYW